MKERRRETIERLKEAMAEMETEDGLVSFVEGHGVQSRFFAFSWRSDDLEIDFRLPFARVLSDEEEQQLDTVRVGAAIKLAILMLSSSDAGTLLQEGEKSILYRLKWSPLKTHPKKITKKMRLLNQILS